ncbi:MAG: glycerophosphodiester phosphodiesterase family protein [Desulfovermiculus sp.]|nr:glycerophosphodiester phosphodiesterase family protein [Desulfovermiculus sp.]
MRTFFMPEQGKSRVLSIAHRGARSLAPENTLQAIRKAHAVGADMCEVDVRLTADDIPVLLHDKVLERISNIWDMPNFRNRRSWAVGALTYEELQQLDCGSWFLQQDPFRCIRGGKVSGAEQESYKGLQLATLEQALELIKAHDWMINIELKDVGPKRHQILVEQACSIVRDLGLVNRVLFSSLRFATLEAVRDQGADFHLAFVDNVVHPQVLRRLLSIRATAYHPKHTLVRPDIIRSCRGGGIAVNVWTVNRMTDLRLLQAMGVDGVITDVPQRMHSMRVVPAAV